MGHQLHKNVTKSVQNEFIEEDDLLTIKQFDQNIIESEYDEEDDLIFDSSGDFLKDIVPNSIFTYREAFHAMVQYDSTVHVVGLVQDIEAPDFKGKNNDQYLSKFIISNNTNGSIQCFVWNDQVVKVLPFVKPNFVIHIDGAFATRKHPRFSNGNTPMDISLRSNTIINVITNKVENSNTQEIAKPIDMSMICDENGLISIKAYIKAPFQEKDSGSSFTYDFGCVANEEFKVEVRFKSMEGKKIFSREDFVSMIGRVYYNGCLPYVLIENYYDVQKIEGKKIEDNKLLLATKIPKRKISELITSALKSSFSFKKSKLDYPSSSFT